MKSKLVPTMVTLAVGAVFGIVFTFSCGDNGSHLDAATCDCPASEPPLAGRFVTIRSQAVAIAAGTVGAADKACPDGSQVISGSCTGINPNAFPQDLVLVESGFFNEPPELPTGWRCTFKNTGSTPIDVRATVICLKPGA